MNLPGLNFQLGEEIDALRDAVHEFAQKEIAPRAAALDKNDQFPMDLWRKMGDLGVLGITVGEEAMAWGERCQGDRRARRIFRDIHGKNSSRLEAGRHYHLPTGKQGGMDPDPAVLRDHAQGDY